MMMCKEINEKELETVTGGYSTTLFKNAEDVTFVHKVGDYVEVYVLFGATVRCRITEVSIQHTTGYCSSHGVSSPSGYYDVYRCEEVESHWYFSNGWRTRGELEN